LGAAFPVIDEREQREKEKL
jgi:hypothetical protein